MTNQIYIANLGKYNEGELVGEWFEFPIDFAEVVEKIGLNEEYEEYAIHDYETVYPIAIQEYHSITVLNDTIEQLDSIEGLAELCEALKGDDKYHVNVWGEDLISVLNEMGYNHDVVDDDYVNDYIKNSSREWEGIKFFLQGANIHNEYHLLDGYENLGELRYEQALTMVKEAINKYLD